jgi:hypothetical protein
MPEAFRSFTRSIYRLKLWICPSFSRHAGIRRAQPSSLLYFLWLGLLPRPCEILLEEGIWESTKPETVSFERDRFELS